MAKKKAKQKVRSHAKLRSTCKFCKGSHTSAMHKFHGKDSYLTSRSIANILKAEAKAKKKRKRK